MNDVPPQWVRLDGSMVSIGLTLGAETRVYLDDGNPPILVIETPGAIVTFDVILDQPQALRVLADLVREVQRYENAIQHPTPPAPAS